MNDSLIDSHVAEAANAAAVSNQANLNALVEAIHDKVAATVKQAVREEMAPENGRYLDISRVPLICQSLIGLDKKMEKMVTQDQFWPIKTLVYSFVALMLGSLILSILALVIVPHNPSL